jgi:hypothetical protein
MTAIWQSNFRQTLLQGYQRDARLHWYFKSVLPSLRVSLSVIADFPEAVAKKCTLLNGVINGELMTSSNVLLASGGKMRFLNKFDDVLFLNMYQPVLCSWEFRRSFTAC